jgi:hypothetical protein
VSKPSQRIARDLPPQRGEYALIDGLGLGQDRRQRAHPPQGRDERGLAGEHVSHQQRGDVGAGSQGLDDAVEEPHRRLTREFG